MARHTPKESPRTPPWSHQEKVGTRCDITVARGEGEMGKRAAEGGTSDGMSQAKCRRGRATIQTAGESNMAAS